MTGKRFIYAVLIAFVAGIMLLVFIQYNSAKNISGLIEGNEKLLSEFKLSNTLTELQKNIITVESDVKDMITTGDSSRLAGMDLQVAEVETDLKKLNQADSNDSIAKYVDELGYLVHEKIAFSNQLLNTYYASGKEAAEKLITIQKGRRLTNAIANIAHKIDSIRQQKLELLTLSIDNNGSEARNWGNVLIVLVLLSVTVIFWFVINRILQQNQLIKQLDISEKKVRESARIKENFMANMSHEIRTPMNAVLGFTNLLLKKNLEADSRSYAESIRQSGDNLLTIINDILDISKIEAGMMRIESTAFSVRELLHSVETMFKEKASQKGLYLTTKIAASVPVVLEGDATRLTQILVNLVGNAIKFTDKGGVEIAFNTQGSTDDKINIGFTVSDTGIGINKEKLSLIFNRFQQAEDSITRKYGGTGLGLSIVKDLVQLQQGTIHVKSIEGMGTQFSCVIPYQVSVVQQITNSRDDAMMTSYTIPGHASVLVVEDNAMNQELMKHLLSGWGLQFNIAANGYEAIDLLQEHHYHLILMDIQMPLMDGYSTADHIRQELQLDTPIIAMTAHALAGEKERCIQHGMNDYIAKPVREDDLHQLIAKFISINKSSGRKEASTSNGKYKLIDLSYMKEVSGGNTTYERTVTQQFVDLLPVEIIKLENAIVAKDATVYKQLAHDLKTTISVMGLTARLQPPLDTIEYGGYDALHISQALDEIKSVCHIALKEAQEFLQTLLLSPLV